MSGEPKWTVDGFDLFVNGRPFTNDTQLDGEEADALALDVAKARRLDAAVTALRAVWTTAEDDWEHGYADCAERALSLLTDPDNPEDPA